MRRILLRAYFLAVTLCIWTAPLGAQSAPPTMPDLSVYGRLGTGTGSGPGQAIPFATLAPKFSGLSKQGLTLISVSTISSAATYSDITSITSACDDYQVVIDDLIPASNNVNLEFLVHSNGSFQNTSYINSAGGVTTYFDIISNGGNLGNVDGVSTVIYLYGVNSSVHKKLKALVSYFTTAPAAVQVNPSGGWTGGTTAIDGFELVMSSGNIASGKVRVYCLRPAL
jgi:hypothetical protein